MWRKSDNAVAISAGVPASVSSNSGITTRFIRAIEKEIQKASAVGQKNLRPSCSND
jgi:hypothetical protein